MVVLFIGNFIALLASLIMVYTGTLKYKKKILFFQTIQIALLIVSNYILGGISGTIINLINLIGNILFYLNKLKTKEKIFITIISTLLILKFNNQSLLGFLPLIGLNTYIWLMNIKNVKKFKLVLVFTTFLWFIYDITIQSYTSALFEAITITMHLITFFQIKKV